MDDQYTNDVNHDDTVDFRFSHLLFTSSLTATSNPTSTTTTPNDSTTTALLVSTTKPTNKNDHPVSDTSNSVLSLAGISPTTSPPPPSPPRQLSYLPPSSLYHSRQQQRKSCHVRWIDLRSSTHHYNHNKNNNDDDDRNHDNTIAQNLCTSREQLVQLLPQLFYYNDSNDTDNGDDETNQNRKRHHNRTTRNHHHVDNATAASNHAVPQYPEPQSYSKNINNHYIMNQYSPWYTYPHPRSHYNHHHDNNHSDDAGSTESSPLRINQIPRIADCTILVLPLQSTNDTSSNERTDNDDHNHQYDYTLLSTFRITDIIPSIALYSSAIIDLTKLSSPTTTKLDPDLNMDHEMIERLSWLLLQPEPTSNDTSKSCQIMIYRKLPPRELLSSRHPKEHNQIPIPGCLYETYISYPTTEGNDSTEDDNHNTGTVQNDQAINSSPTIIYRMVGPPYIDSHSNCGQLYNHLQRFFIRPHIQLLLQQEVQRIQEYFIAWPEAQHYNTTSTSITDYDDDNDIDNIIEAPWNVYPLCYCFPGNDVTKRKFIPKTCQYVPNTIQLLQECFNSFPALSYTFDDDYDDDGIDDCAVNVENVDSYLLRTALYSRLEPDSVLEAHTGWADLANHVYRVHIPIHVPTSEPNVHIETQSSQQLPLPLSSCCGTWVDGCVQYHDMNSIIMFDDSKVHRAFNYSKDSSRTVLIIDVARPTNVYPIGTATGGHSNELDTFIEQFQ